MGRRYYPSVSLGIFSRENAVKPEQEQTARAMPEDRKAAASFGPVRSRTRRPNRLAVVTSPLHSLTPGANAALRMARGVGGFAKPLSDPEPS